MFQESVGDFEYFGRKLDSRTGGGRVSAAEKEQPLVDGRGTHRFQTERVEREPSRSTQKIEATKAARGLTSQHRQGVTDEKATTQTRRPQVSFEIISREAGKKSTTEKVPTNQQDPAPNEQVLKEKIARLQRQLYQIESQKNVEAQKAHLKILHERYEDAYAANRLVQKENQQKNTHSDEPTTDRYVAAYTFRTTTPSTVAITPKQKPSRSSSRGRVTFNKANLDNELIGLRLKREAPVEPSERDKPKKQRIIVLRPNRGYRRFKFQKSESNSNSSVTTTTAQPETTQNPIRIEEVDKPTTATPLRKVFRGKTVYKKSKYELDTPVAVREVVAPIEDEVITHTFYLYTFPSRIKNTLLFFSGARTSRIV